MRFLGEGPHVQLHHSAPDYLTPEQVEQRPKALLVTCCYEEARRPD